MANKSPSLENWSNALLRSDPPRSKSLIVTVFGDSVAPCTDTLWLSELIALLEPFRFSERLIRTSSFRLVEEGWLESERVGRRSRYTLTARGKDELQRAQPRIYQPAAPDWNGEWTLVILSKASAAVAERVELRKQLEWEGFGLLAPGMLLHPAADRIALDAKLAQLDLSQGAIAVSLRDLALPNSRPLTQLVKECWSLGEVATRYRHFIKQFQPLQARLACNSSPAPEAAFVAQTLLIHGYRRASLHDPRLPASMLPPDWSGHRAYALCRTIYRLLQPCTRCHLRERLGRTPPALERFA